MSPPYPTSAYGEESPFDGPSLLDRYKGKPVGEIRFRSAPPPQRPAVDPDYLRKTRENDPWPEGSSGAPPSQKPPEPANAVALSNCRFLTPPDQLHFNETFEMAVDVRRTAPGKTRRAFFDLHQSWIRDGVPEEISIVKGIEGFPDSDGTTHTVKAKEVLETAMPYVLGETVDFWLTATHLEAAEPATSPKVQVVLQAHALWLGGSDIHFALDGEFPRLGADGSLISVLAAALKRTAKPPEPDRPEVAICFGYASSSGEPDANRRLSRRRAEVVKAILARDEKSWEPLAKDNFRTEDLQQFLSDLAALTGIACDPGAVDGVEGRKTKAAVESFQRHANTSWNLGLVVDGKCGRLTWNAILRQIFSLVQKDLGNDPAKLPDWTIPTWGNSGKGVYGNGEDFASAEENPDERSVQIVFFASGSEPILVDPPEKTRVTTKENPVEDRKQTKKTKLAPTTTGAAMGSGKDVYLYVDSPKTLDEAFRIQMGLRPKPQKSTASGWTSATEEEVRDAMDPRAHSAGSDLFQFFDISGSNNLSEQDLAAYLADKGILAGHAADFLEASREAGVSEIYAAVHACLETGNGTSALAKGVSVNGVTVHNMFGIGALDGKAEATGSKKAFDLGWTSPSLAIRGGIAWIADHYIKQGQNTLFKMRWNPAKPGVHQYATAYNWALAQTAKMKRIGADFPNATKVFEISRYKDHSSWTIADKPQGKKPTPAAPAPKPPPTPAPLDDQFADLRRLVEAAEAEGYDMGRVVSAVRKIWYNGFLWDKVIPGAKAVAQPASWQQPGLAEVLRRVRANAVMEIGFGKVDVGHLFAGLDARNHRSNVDLLVIKLRSNQEQSTFLGDLGSVAAEYIHTFPGSFYDMARKLDKTFLAKKFDEYCSAVDMAGNMDAFVIDVGSYSSVMDMLDTYYALGPGMSLQRERLFAPVARGTNRDTWKQEVYNSALGYAGGQVYKGKEPLWAIDVGDVILNPVPGWTFELPVLGDIGVPTWWEAYQNVSGWVVDLFLERYGKAGSEAPPPPEKLPKPYPVERIGNLEYYKFRDDDFRRRNPTRPPPEDFYYMSYGDKYVRRFTVETSPTLTEEGQKWLVEARKLLQIAIENRLRYSDRNRDAATIEFDDEFRAFKKFAFDSHPDAYWDAGLKSLETLDLVKIVLTPDIKDLLSPEGIDQATDIGRLFAEYWADHPVEFAKRSGEALIHKDEIERLIIEKALREAYPKEKIPDLIHDMIRIMVYLD
ncbi:MAG: glucosaminidase domain-containing protein [Fibrobacteria bacterium]|nr:glucosaminidase domain-containing protein [Fibrobacteria bacterium]